MKNKLIPALVVLLLTPGLLFAARPSVSAQEQALNILVDALVVCPPNSPTRFVDNGDGTVCDHQTGLMWEQKDGGDGTVDPNNPRDVDNNYTWSISGGPPDGTAYTDFLARLNGPIANTNPSEQLGGHRDWRLPTSAELQTILDCSFSPCTDPTFGPTAASFYWSSTSDASSPLSAWAAFFGNGGVFFSSKSNGDRVRAVRGGR
jgi:hypothetical protein